MTITSNIYSFSDYRAFLKDRYRQLKEADPVFSFRHFSKQAGFGSPNYLKLVMDGKRNLSSEAVAKFAKGLRLDTHESEFFRYMVDCNQCDNPAKKKVYEAKLSYLRELFNVKTLIPELYDYYHEWYHSAIREMVRKGGVRNNPAEIASALVPNITEAEALQSIQLLKSLKFIVETPIGTLDVTEGVGEVEAKSKEIAAKIHHEQMAELAAQSLYTQGPDTQEFESVTVSLPATKVAELRERIRALVAEVTAQGAPGESIYQLNVQLFALTRPWNVPAEQPGASAEVA